MNKEDLEIRFIDEWITEHKNCSPVSSPTFADAIEWTIQNCEKKISDWLNSDSVIMDAMSIGGAEDMREFAKNCIKAMAMH